jgi:hypothetical protein
MTETQRARLVALLPAMKTMARRKVSQNDYFKAWAWIDALEGFMRGQAWGCVEYQKTVEEWISIAEKAAEGHDKPGIVRMPSMAAVLSGMPPEHKEEA